MNLGGVGGLERIFVDVMKHATAWVSPREPCNYYNCSCCRPSNPSASGSNSDRRLHALLALVLILGAAQMLWVTQKRVMTRVMLCTATSMLVMALAIVGALTPPYMGRLFFQSAALPLLLLFMESSSPAPPRGAPEHC
jgi:hypothetical protein